eukprot:2657123-Rhodomonas_salina.13
MLSACAHKVQKNHRNACMQVTQIVRVARQTHKYHCKQPSRRKSSSASLNPQQAKYKAYVSASPDERIGPLRDSSTHPSLACVDGGPNGDTAAAPEAATCLARAAQGAAVTVPGAGAEAAAALAQGARIGACSAESTPAGRGAFTPCQWGEPVSGAAARAPFPPCASVFSMAWNESFGAHGVL